jgi:ABC-2 type transport system ATP-binding protein
VEGLRIRPPSLEELFLRPYGDDLDAGESIDGGSADPRTRRERNRRDAS